MLTQKELKEALHYNPSTGLFTRLVSFNGCVVGEIAGTKIPTGYINIGVNGTNYRAHRLAFLYMTGEMPKICDHINRIRDDNKWCNLRAATPSQNGANRKQQSNNSSGYRGVSWRESDKRWHAKIKSNGVNIHIGNFKCKHHAFCEYVLASRRIFGYFSTV